MKNKDLQLINTIIDKQDKKRIIVKLKLRKKKDSKKKLLKLSCYLSTILFSNFSSTYFYKMKLTGKILEIKNEITRDNLKERIITIISDYKKQKIDIYCYNKNSFLTGFLDLDEVINFDIVLQGLENEIEDKRETRVILKKIIEPNIILTKNHLLIEFEYIRVYSNEQLKSGK